MPFPILFGGSVIENERPWRDAYPARGVRNPHGKKKL